MKLPLRKILALQAGLVALDGYDRAVKDGEREKVVHEYFTLGGGVRLAIAKNLNRIEEPVQAYTKARNGLITQYANGAASVPGEKMPAFFREETGLLDAEHEVDLVQLTEAELQLDKNPIPGTLLAQIAVILAGA